MNHVELSGGEVLEFEFKLVDLSTLKEDCYQRSSTADQRAKQLIREWERDKCLPLYIGERANGDQYAVDGSARRRALLKMGVMSIMCFVFKSAGRAHEARIFDALNGRNTKRITQLQGFCNNVMGENPKALAIKELINRSGFAVQSLDEPLPGQPITESVVAIQRMLEFGEDHALRVLELIRQTWPSDRRAGSSQIIRAVSTFLIAHESGIDEDHFRKAFGIRNIEFVLEVYASYKKTSVTADSRKCLYLAMIAIYNKGLREHRVLSNQSERLGPLTRDYLRRRKTNTSSRPPMRMYVHAHANGEIKQEPTYPRFL